MKKRGLFWVSVIALFLLSIALVMTAECPPGVTICGQRYDCGANDNVCPEDYGATCRNNASCFRPDPQCPASCNQKGAGAGDAYCPGGKPKCCGAAGSGHCESACSNAQCGLCQILDSSGGLGNWKCANESAGTDVKNDCIPGAWSCIGASPSCSRNQSSDFCNGLGACGSTTANIASGFICSGGNPVAPNAGLNCGVETNCALGNCSASTFYRSCNGAGICRAAGDRTGATPSPITAPINKILTAACGNQDATAANSCRSDNAPQNFCTDGTCSGGTRYSECNGAGGCDNAAIVNYQLSAAPVFAQTGFTLTGACGTAGVTACNPADACSVGPGDGNYSTGGNFLCKATCGSGHSCNFATSCVPCGAPQCSDTGNSFVVKDTATFQGGCAGSSCLINSQQTDYCVGNTVHDLTCGAGRTLAADTTYNCDLNDTTTCSCNINNPILNRTCNNWDCFDGACRNTGSLLETNRWTCAAGTECNRANCGGFTYNCSFSNAGAYAWTLGALPIETNCVDGHDNDCNGRCDYDNSVCSRGDFNCPVSITAAPIVSNPTPCPAEIIDVTCTSSVAGVQSIDATMDGIRANCNWIGWVGNTVKFKCTTRATPGPQTVACSVNISKSEPGATPSRSTVINVGGVACCSQYTAGGAGPCNADSNCEWCPQCNANPLLFRQYRGGADACVQKGTCAGSYVCNNNTLGAPGEYCNAHCDSTDAPCTKLSQCVGKRNQTNTGWCQADCTCSYGGWVDSSCTVSNQTCGAPCTTGQSMPCIDMSGNPGTQTCDEATCTWGICTSSVVCGDNILGGIEQCELRGSPNNNYCTQATLNCSNAPFTRTRDQYGNCDNSCQCVNDSWSAPVCNATQCGAACDATSAPQACTGPTGNPGLQSCNLTNCNWGVCVENAFCGDGIRDAGEECDNASNNGVPCIPGYGTNCTYCTLNTCKNATVVGSHCGDLVVDAPFEDCEGSNCEPPGNTLKRCNATSCKYEQSPPENTFPSGCVDDIDNDCDGFIDGRDGRHLHGTLGMITDCFEGQGKIGSVNRGCSDLGDNDGDTKTDEDDPGCCDIALMNPTTGFDNNSRIEQPADSTCGGVDAMGALCTCQMYNISWENKPLQQHDYACGNLPATEFFKRNAADPSITGCCNDSTQCIDNFERICQNGKEETLALCMDGKDNDCDGMIDMADTNCTGTVQGYVYDEKNNPIANAVVQSSPPGLNAMYQNQSTTRYDGFFKFNALIGSYDFIARKQGYDDNVTTLTIIPQGTTNHNFVLRNGSCHADCTDSYGNCNAACNGVTFNTSLGPKTCIFATDACYNRPKGFRVTQLIYNVDHQTIREYTCCESIPRDYQLLKALITGEAENLVVTTYKVKMGEEIVDMNIAYWK